MNKKYNQDNIYKFDKIKDTDINTYTLKINSKNRNIGREPNPFSFEISFNQPYDENKAVIPSNFENIKRIQLSQILMPRYIPRDYMGEPFNGITPLYNTDNTVTLSYYPGININNSVITYLNNSNVEVKIEVLESVDLSCKKTYLVADQYNNPYKLSKLVTLKAEVYSYLNINNNIYRINEINGNIITLDNTDNYPIPMNTNNRLIIGDFYKNTTIIDMDGTKVGITNNSIIITNSNILNYQYIFKNQYLEYQVNSDESTIIEKKLFKVSTVTPIIVNNNIIPTTNLIDPNNVNIVITGEWTEDLPSNYTSGTFFDSNNIIRISQFNFGVRDLLDEKIFYLNLNPFVPSKEVSTDVDVNNTFGVLFPSTQSKDYLYLRGEALENYTNINLQSTNSKLKFSLMDSNNQLIGTIFNNYFNLLSPNNYYSYFEKILSKKNLSQTVINTIKNKYDNNVSILSYLPYYPELSIIIKIEEIDPKFQH